MMMEAIRVPAAPLFAEETHTLSGQWIREVMEDDLCMGLPRLKAVDDTFQRRYFVSLKSLDTQEEYMHPRPLNTLTGYQNYFLNCYLFERQQHAVAGSVFPILKLPGQNGVGPVSMENFELMNGARFQAVAVVDGGEMGNMAVFVRSPQLPSSMEALNVLWPSKNQKLVCSNHFGVVGLLTHAFGASVQWAREGQNDGLDMAGPANSTDGADLVLANLLIHGKEAVSPLQRQRSCLSGATQLFELERTAGSVSLPLVLRHLHWLQFIAQDEARVPYRIIAPNKFAYAVHMPNVFGWEIFFSVNMWCTPNEFPQLFLLASQGSVTTLMPPRSSQLLLQGPTTAMTRANTKVGSKDTARYLAFHDRKFKEAIAEGKRIIGNLGLRDMDTWDPATFGPRMQLVGMQNMQGRIARQSEVMASYLSIEEAKPMLQHLIGFFERFGSRTSNMAMPVSPFSVETVLKIAYEAFFACAVGVWDALPGGNDVNSKERADEFIRLLNTDMRGMVIVFDYDLLPILLKCCLSRPNATWWQVAQDNVSMRDTAADPSEPQRPDPAEPFRIPACICTTFMFHNQLFGAYFPQTLFPEYAKTDWPRLLQEACDSGAKLQKGRNLLERLKVVDANRYNNGKNVRRKMDYCAAVAYAMLKGLKKNTGLEIKGM